MMKQSILRTCILFGILGVPLALAGLFLVPQREGVTVAAVTGRLTLGMTEAEIGAAVDRAGDYTGGFLHYF